MLMLRLIGALMLVQILSKWRAVGVGLICLAGLFALSQQNRPEATVAAAALSVSDSSRFEAPPPPPPRPPRVDSTEVLWLARAIYSETKLPHEQELVAWVIRNRVETGYRGRTTYQEVVLDPWQFSAFNRNSPKRRYYSGLTYDSTPAGFQRALEIAHHVAHAASIDRPFAQNTRHFYSERSMRGRRAPQWAVNKKPVRLDRTVDPRRFRFFAGIS